MCSLLIYVTNFPSKVIDMFRGCKQEDMPPHIYAMAQTSYRNMQAMRMDQSIILLGRSGSGKTTNLKHLLHYYANVTSSIHSCVNCMLPLFAHFSISFEEISHVLQLLLVVFVLAKTDRYFFGDNYLSFLA